MTFVLVAPTLDETGPDLQVGWFSLTDGVEDDAGLQDQHT